METRRLGRTGQHSSLAIFGAVSFWWSDQAEADASLNTALDYGVNHIDVAPQYGNAQEVVGHWLRPHRDRFFLGCKTLERARDAAMADLENSLRLLRTDHVDLYQLHAIATFELLDEVCAPGGALETLVAAREQGKTRWLGITSHGMLAPRVELEALRRFDFDTVMFPLNARLYADPAYRRDAEALLAECQRRDVGAIVIKAIAKGPWKVKTDRRPTPWYEPYHDYENIERNLRFALSQPGVACAASVGNIAEAPLFFKAADAFTPMDAAEQAALIEQRAAEEEELIFVGPRFNAPE